MDLEQLNTSQLILLTLFVSFITSMATGVATVSLMQETPTSVAQTVSRVIERTVHEIITPATSTPVVQPIVTSDTSSVAAIVQKVSPSILRMYTADTVATFLGLATVVDSSGGFVADAGSIGEASEVVVDSNGTKVRAIITRKDTLTGIAYLNATSTTSSSSVMWTPVSLSRSPRGLGDSVFTINNGKSFHLARGIITSITQNTDINPTTAETDIVGLAADTGSSGSPLFTANGTFIGIRTHVSQELALNTFVLFNNMKISKEVKVSTSTKSN